MGNLMVRNGMNDTYTMYECYEYGLMQDEYGTILYE